MIEQALEQSEKKIGAAATLVGSAGLTVQMLTDWMGLGLMAVNLILAVGGLYLLFHKIRRLHKEE